MAINFWEQQRKARTLTTIYLALFVLLTLLTAVIVEVALRTFAEAEYDPSLPLVGGGFLAVTFLVAAYNYAMYQRFGGSYVAESVGAYRVDLNTSNPVKRQLVHIVQEMAVATSLPVPTIYIIPSEQINAFAAGLKKDNAAIAITAGALKRLNRDEIQSVIAHEFGHIYNGDMLISLRLAAMVIGFFFVLYIGFRLFQFAGFRRDEDRQGGGAVISIAALAFIAAGALAWFIGSILKATVSRQREYLADASSAQFTRNPMALVSALKKIAKDSARDMPSTGSAFSHMYLEDHTSIFATHPPISKRIAALEGSSSG